MKAAVSKRPALPRSVWVLGFVSLLTDLSSEIYHALLPAFVTVTLALPVVALGAIDGIAEATASFAKLASGRLSDRSRKRKPWILAGYGLAALSKPLFPIATSGLAVMAARFCDRVGKGIRGAPRDAMIADETPPEIRGRAFGLRQALDTVGAVLAPLAAVGLMVALSNDIRLVFWIAAIPAFASVLLIVVALREPERHLPRDGIDDLLRRLPRASRRHPAAAQGRVPVHARPLLGRLPDPARDGPGRIGGAVAAGAGGVQHRLPGARLSGRRAQRPPVAALDPADRDRRADRRQSAARRGFRPGRARRSASCCGARTWR